MSHEIVKSIRFRAGKVYIKSASNNVWPRDFVESEWDRLTALLQEQGREACEKEILNLYFMGYLEGNDKYAVAVRRYLTKNYPRTSVYDLWDEKNENPELEKELKSGFHEMLKNPPKKEPCALMNDKGLFVTKITRRRYFTHRIRKKEFHNPLDAEHALNYYGFYKAGFKIVRVKF